MKRREFLKNASLGSLLVSTSGLYVWKDAGTIQRSNGNQSSAGCLRPPQDIPVIQDVDVVIVGGGAGAVAAATAIGQKGFSSFVVTTKPYLGEDICGTYQLWPEEKPDTSLARQLFEGSQPPRPLHIKQTLDEALMSQDIDFVYNSFINDLLVDDEGQLAGVVIVNRTGEQAILASKIIDASKRASVARRAGADAQPFKSGNYSFRFITLGNKPDEEKSELQRRRLSPDVVMNEEETYAAWEFKADLELKDSTYASFAGAEQKMRDLTWDPSQIDSADDLIFVSPDPVKCKNQWKQAGLYIDQIPIECTMPENLQRLYVLGESADISREAAQSLLDPVNLIAFGYRMGETVSNTIKDGVDPQNVSVKSSGTSFNPSRDTNITYDFMRPSKVMRTLPQQELSIPVIGNYDVLVVGGGTAGAPAAISAARHGAKTLCIEHLHGLGGLTTKGYIGRYWHGYRKGFTREVDEGVKELGGEHSRKTEDSGEWVQDWKMEWFRKELRKADGEIWFEAIGCGALIEFKQVKGVVIVTPFGRGIVMANTVIDSTGSGDVAIAAGANYQYTNGESVAVQGAGLPLIKGDQHYVNTDWTFVDDTDMFDIQRTFVVGKHMNPDAYDVGELLQTRERRRIVGEFEVSVLDIYNKRTYPDIISVHKSSFDTHGYTISPFLQLKPPEGSDRDVTAYVPFRSLLPKGLDNIVVTGLGVSAQRDAMPVIRMQPCLQNQGYAVGLAASMVAESGASIRQVPVQQLQQKLVEKGNLSADLVQAKDPFPPSAEKLEEAVQKIKEDFKELEYVLWDQERAIPLLKNAFDNSRNFEDQLVYAHVLGVLGDAKGYKVLMKAIEQREIWDEGWDYTGMGQFGSSMSRLDSLIIALGRTQKKEVVPVILQKAKQLYVDHAFSHFRAIAEALQHFKDQEVRQVLYDLLDLPNMTGHDITSLEEAKNIDYEGLTDTQPRNASLKELHLARALYLSGDHKKRGKSILQRYTKDLRGHYARYACDLLNS